jgi:hypothetical protein
VEEVSASDAWVACYDRLLFPKIKPLAFSVPDGVAARIEKIGLKPINALDEKIAQSC